MEANALPAKGNCACQAPSLALPPDPLLPPTIISPLPPETTPLAISAVGYSDHISLVILIDSRHTSRRMNIPAHSSPFMDIDSPSYSRWSYATSNARSEPSTVHTTMPQARSIREAQPVRCPPPTAAPPSPVQTSPGIWEDDDGIYYGSNWSPVQQYLDRIREERRMLVAPSEIIFVLAALDVVYSPWDVAHWIFWPSATYYNTADRVTAIALHQPRLIVTKIPWIGSREHRWIVNAIQEKYYYVHILGRWYPTDFQPLETKKRTLRSSGAIDDRLDMTVNQFFNIVEDGLPPSKRQRRPPKKIAEPQIISEDKRPRGAPHRKNTITAHSGHTPPLEDVPTPRSDVSTLATNSPSSGRDKRHASPPATDTAAISPTDSEAHPTSSFTSDLSLSASHSRNRSTSQSSEQTVVAEDQDQRRSVSVESATTAVAPSSLSKKRKAEALDGSIEESDLQQSEESAPAEGMITRGRSKITRVSGVEDVKRPSTRLSPITRRTKLTPRAKSKKTRS